MGDGIELLGYEVTHQVTAGFTVGSPLTVTLVWRASQAPAQDYTVFVHLMDGEGNQIAHHDGIPMAGQYPTSWWLEGDVMWDAHVLRPERLPGEALHLLVGMYDAVTGQRLPVLSVRQGRAIDNAVWVDWTPVDQDAIHGP